MKRWLVLLLCVSLLCITGCSFSEPDDTPDTPNTPSHTDYSAEFAGKWCYQRLDAQQQENYAAVYAAIRDGFSTDNTVTLEDPEAEDATAVNGETVTLPRPLSTAEEIAWLYTAVLRDNPEFFHVGSTYSYEGYRTGHTTRYKTLYLTYTMDAAKRIAAKAELDSKVNQFVAATKNLGTQYEKELWLHDMLLESCEYNKEAAASQTPLTEYPADFTAYGALVKGKAVCEGYANAMQLLLSRVGIVSTPVSGYDEEERPHMWNMVQVDGGHYYLDATWNDMSSRISHLYFNLNTADLLLSHTLDEDNFGLSEYTDTAANYYVRSGRFVDDYDRDKIAALVAEAVEAGETDVELRFKKDKYASAQLFVNNADWFSSMVTEKMTAGSLWDYGYSLSDVYHVIKIYKKS